MSNQKSNNNKRNLDSYDSQDPAADLFNFNNIPSSFSKAAGVNNKKEVKHYDDDSSEEDGQEAKKQYNYVKYHEYSKENKNGYKPPKYKKQIEEEDDSDDEGEDEDMPKKGFNEMKNDFANDMIKNYTKKKIEKGFFENMGDWFSKLSKCNFM